MRCTREVGSLDFSSALQVLHWRHIVVVLELRRYCIGIVRVLWWFCKALVLHLYCAGTFSGTVGVLYGFLTGVVQVSRCSIYGSLSVLYIGPGIDETWPELVQNRPNSARNRPNLARNRPTSTELGLDSAELAWESAN